MLEDINIIVLASGGHQPVPRALLVLVLAVSPVAAVTDEKVGNFS